MGSRWLPFAAVCALAIAACGDDDTPDTQPTDDSVADAEVGDSSDGDSTDTELDAGATGGPASPTIDATGMPATGDARFDVEGSSYEFAAADSAQSAYVCTVDPTTVTVEFQLAPGALLVQATNPDGDTWQGDVTISPPGADRIDFSTPGFDGTFAVDGTTAVYEGDFFWRTSDDPGLREEAGTGTVAMSC